MICVLKLLVASDSSCEHNKPLGVSRGRNTDYRLRRRIHRSSTGIRLVCFVLFSLYVCVCIPSSIAFREEYNLNLPSIPPFCGTVIVMFDHLFFCYILTHF